MNLRDADLKTRALKYFKGSATRVRMKVIVKRIRPQNDLAFVKRCRGWMPGRFFQAGNPILPGPLLESGPGELRHAPLRGQVKSALQDVTEARRLAEKIGDARSNRSELRPAIY